MLGTLFLLPTQILPTQLDSFRSRPEARLERSHLAPKQATLPAAESCQQRWHSSSGSLFLELRSGVPPSESVSGTSDLSVENILSEPLTLCSEAIIHLSCVLFVLSRSLSKKASELDGVAPVNKTLSAEFAALLSSIHPTTASH